MNFDDLKNLDLKNLNVEDLKQKVLAFADKKTLIKVGISLGSIIVFLIIYYAILNPIVEKKRNQINDMNTKQEEITKFDKEIVSVKRKIKKIKPKYENYSTLFHSKAEVEGLYQNLSEFATLNGLVISVIEKGKPQQVSRSEILNKSKKKKKKKKKKSKKAKSKKDAIKNIAYYTIPVKFEINGNFIGYIKFKRALSLSNKMLNFESERIQVEKGDSTGAIKVSGTLTIVGLADEFF
ncbi:pilus assembly protein PilO [Candidatus Pelagibacter communis]|uniref:pilus assembly protein PilO n=1 Tax=Pelagibacter ubique TaxID=198252 RepID=UPI00094C9FB8|nr:pilus assembly protein PilO [Candidatus Pelagibacter ubique]|tara:strand:- start:770 stop:1480 length:711 start_codon:yes stop_codon:yes gene_type:complete